MLSRSVVSDSLWPHGLRPTRLLCLWDSPGKNTGVDTVIQAYAPTSNAEEAEVERLYEDLQDLLELHPKKMSLSL